MSSSTKNYDVFISFRGEDTRTNFTSHLHSALLRDNIRTYTDDYLQKGDAVWPALSKAIENSHVAIVVFSKNYAFSKWCLEELIKILQCRKSQGQVVIPVFYEVDPSHVRKQTGSYGEAFAKHERVLRVNNNNDSIQKKVSEWKAALAETANISGYDSRCRDYKNDFQLIEKIVKDVLEKLRLRYPNELEVEGLVGIDKICEYVEFLLSKYKQNQLLKNVKVIGIWGMGGIGKTTIAKAVFSKLFPQYDSVCFLTNIREESERLGQKSLRDKLLLDLLKEENLNSNPSESTFIRKSLSSKKVFIVLDDVNSSDQLDELYRVYKYAGLDSKLIITTRDRHLLSGRVDEIYKGKIWSFDESLELFCLHAFKERQPQKRYENLSKRAVDYAGGVPLALKVLGSNLYSKSTDFWDSELEKLKNYPNDKIQNVLQVSYDGLDTPQKEIFLDIAFFFKDKNKYFVQKILNACGFSATSGIEVLEDKALITISNDKKIQMHDLLQEMGLKIVRHGIKSSGRRSRLKDIGEVYDVLKNKKGSDAVEGISLDLSHIDDLLSLSADAFDMMTNLRFLKLYISSDKRSGKVDYPRVLNKISDNLRYLEWDGYRLKYLPATFCAKMLVEIRMPHSHVIELWQGVQDVVNLELIDLSECKQLKNVPDLSKASKLKWVNLTGCESLQVVHPSVLSLDTLQTLILDSCKKLKSLKSEKHLRSLKKINVDGCTSLKQFSVLSDSVERLDLRNTGIEKLDPSIGRLSILWSLNLEGLKLRNLPNEFSSLKYLCDFRISNCRLPIDKQKLHVLFNGLKYLEILYLKDCCNLFELPDNISNLSFLYELRLDGSSVKRLPESLKLLDSLQILSLKNCMKLRCLPGLPPFINEFYAVNCRSLVTVSTFVAEMKEKEKFFLFQNCKKLDGPSLRCIMEGAHLTMMKAVNIRVNTYNSINVCLPGSRVPGQFTHKIPRSIITINLPSFCKLLGIILCAVYSPSWGVNKHGAKIFCQCYLEDGTKVGDATTWDRQVLFSDVNDIMELDSDHIYMWYDQFHLMSTKFDSITTSFKHQVSFEFYVANDEGERDVLNIGIKECGVYPIFGSELNSHLRGLELRSEQRLELDDNEFNEKCSGFFALFKSLAEKIF